VSIQSALDALYNLLKDVICPNQEHGRQFHELLQTVHATQDELQQASILMKCAAWAPSQYDGYETDVENARLTLLRELGEIPWPEEEPPEIDIDQLVQEAEEFAEFEHVQQIQLCPEQAYSALLGTDWLASFWTHVVRNGACKQPLEVALRNHATSGNATTYAVIAQTFRTNRNACSGHGPAAFVEFLRLIAHGMVPQSAFVSLASRNEQLQNAQDQALRLALPNLNNMAGATPMQLQLVVGPQMTFLQVAVWHHINRTSHKLNSSDKDRYATVTVGPYTVFLHYVMKGSIRIRLRQQNGPDPSYAEILSTLASASGTLDDCAIAARMIAIYQDIRVLGTPTVCQGFTCSGAASALQPPVSIDEYLVFLVVLLWVGEPVFALPLLGSAMDVLGLVRDGMLTLADMFGHSGFCRGGLYPLYNTGEHEGSATALAFSTNVQQMHTLLGRADYSEPLMADSYSCAMQKALFAHCMYHFRG
jgi:hypothetical protein